MSGVNSCNTPTFEESKKASRVMVFIYRETAHNFGGATETGVQKVTMFMDVSGVLSLSTCRAAKDQTGIDIAGGSGIEGEATKALIFCNKQAHASTISSTVVQEDRKLVDRCNFILPIS